MSDKLREAALAALNMLNDYHDCLQAANILRVGLSEQEPVAHPFEDSAVISALTWAASLIEKEYPVGHNGADSWLMNYSDKHGEHIRRSDHREWEKVHGRWKPKAAPPRREWVGLTDADFEKEKFVDYNFMSGASFAEAKLREKNT